MTSQQEWVARIQAEIRDVIDERDQLIRSVTTGRDGLLIEPRRRGQICKRTYSNLYSTWLDLDDRAIYYHEQVGQKERRWQAPRTPSLVQQLEAMTGRVLRLRAEARSAGWNWEPMVKAAVLHRREQTPA